MFFTRSEARRSLDSDANVGLCRVVHLGATFTADLLAGSSNSDYAPALDTDNRFSLIGQCRVLRRTCRLAGRGESTTAQLQALKMQLQPHFLFNALNSISSLIDEEPAVAVKMVARLGDFLRLTLYNSGRDEISLREEIEFLRAYLEIQMIRFDDRLTVEIEVPPELSEARVPNLILQPLVENAIRHGISRLTDRGVIKIRAARLNGTLKLDVEDNGPGMSEVRRVPETGPGVGLLNTKARLANIYGEGQHLELTNLPARGLRVSIDIPFRIDSDAKTS